MLERLKILNLFPNSDGCQYVRHLVPFRELRARGHYVKMDFPIHRSDFNIAILSRMANPALIETLVKMRIVGMKIILDWDDNLFELEEENPYFSDTKTQAALYMMKRIMPLIDMVTVTCEELRETMKQYTMAPIRVLPNCVDPRDWNERPRAQRETVRIGYAGACSHHKELNFLIPIIRELQKTHDIEFHIFGIFTSLEKLEKDATMQLKKPAVWQSLMKETQRLLKTIRYVHHDYVTIENYPKTLAAMDLDIGLCPLFSSPFNDCKSPIKFFEYAMVGTAPLCSDAAPYQFCSNQAPMDAKLWKENLEAMIRDKQYRETIAFNAKTYTLENFDIRKRVQDWEEVYSEALHPQPTILLPQGIGH